MNQPDFVELVMCYQDLTLFWNIALLMMMDQQLHEYDWLLIKGHIVMRYVAQLQIVLLEYAYIATMDCDFLIVHLAPSVDSKVITSEL